MKQPLSIVRGTTMTLQVSVKNTDGSTYILGDDEILRFGVSEHAGDRAYLFVKEMTSSDADGDSYAFTINPADTANLEFGCYQYDIGLQSGNDYYNVIECNDFRVAHNVTRWADGD